MCHINVDVKCHWSENPPIYRIYIDGDLITERTFGWPGYDTFLRENIICNLDSGIHNINIENCSPNGSFLLENFEMKENPNPLHPNLSTSIPDQLTFVVP